MPNFGYHFARWLGKRRRNSYRRSLAKIVQDPIDPPRSLPLHVFSYSNEEMLPEQVASIRSLLRYAGRPEKFTVVSDGSHSEESFRLLQKIDPCVAVARAKGTGIESPDRYGSYLQNHPTGKQLGLIMTLPREGPSLYIDADVLFFPGAGDLAGLVTDSNPVRYLADCQFSGDERLIRDPAEMGEPVNTGVLFLRAKPDWALSIARFMEIPGDPTFFTNQTMTHLAMHQSGARPLDPARYVLQLDDQFEFADRHASPNLVLRHYVNPVRHKFWNSLR